MLVRALVHVMTGKLARIDRRRLERFRAVAALNLVQPLHHIRVICRALAVARSSLRSPGRMNDEMIVQSKLGSGCR